MLWLLFLYTHNQYNYSNNYQIINYSLKGYLLAEQWDVFFYLLSLIGSFYLMFFVFVFVLLLLLLLLLILILFCYYANIIFILLLFFVIIIIIIIICFVLSSILFVNVCINVLYPFIFFFMPQVKNQQSHSLHLILAYFIFVTTIFRLFLNFTILYF